MIFLLTLHSCWLRLDILIELNVNLSQSKLKVIDFVICFLIAMHLTEYVDSSFCFSYTFYLLYAFTHNNTWILFKSMTQLCTCDWVCLPTHQELSRQLFLETVELQNQRERLEWASTFQGRFFNFMGYFFSMYCSWKIFIVSSLSIFVSWYNFI